MASSLFFLWRHVSQEQIAKLEATIDPVEVKQILKNIFHFNYGDKRKFKIILDFHFYNYAFCKERGFNAEKTSTFMSLVNEIWLRDTGDSASTRANSFQFFQTELFKHAIQNPPKSIKIFEEEEVTFVLNYFTDSYYRHFNLYKYVFTPLTRVVFKQSCANEVEKPKTDMLALNEGYHIQSILPPAPGEENNI